jgi:putative ABC transport system permease protein
MSFILAEPKPGVPLEAACKQIQEQTGLKALTRKKFIDTTIEYYLKRTGIPMNFGITVLLGVIVGTAISGQTFYLFTVENLKQFGALKAMGTSNLRIVKMVLFQAVQVGFIGYCLGVGGAAGFGYLTRFNAKLAFYMPWEVLVITGVIVVLIVILASLLCVWKVIKVEPAIVFKG